LKSAKIEEAWSGLVKSRDTNVRGDGFSIQMEESDNSYTLRIALWALEFDYGSSLCPSALSGKANESIQVETRRWAL
jgi:hypothetical protein